MTERTPRRPAEPGACPRKTNASGYGGRYSVNAPFMKGLQLNQPLVFEPLFMERIWGGRRLETILGKRLPSGGKFGEAWEIVDRPEAQSVVRVGPLAGKTLHDLWTNHRPEIFGRVPNSTRFPLLIKWLAAEDKLSLQVHPPAAVAKRMGAEPKTEFWYVAKADSDAQLFVGLRQQTTKDDFRRAIEHGTVAEHVHPIAVKEGDAMFLPAGRFHAIGAGNLLVEVQQNSDTTYRVFDWNRTDDAGNLRELHVEFALECIDFADCQPELVQPNGEILVRDQLFEIQKWTVAAPRQVGPAGQFALVCCLDGEMKCAGISMAPGEFCLVPAESPNRQVEPAKKQAILLRITIPEPAS